MLQRFVGLLSQNTPLNAIFPGRSSSSDISFSEAPDIEDLRGMNDEEFLRYSRPQLEELEVIRQEKYALYKKRRTIAMPLAATLGPLLAYVDYWLLWLQSSNDDSAAGLSVAFLGGLYAWVTSPKRQYASAYKNEILPKLANLFGRFTYTPNGQIPVHLMQPSKILPAHDRYESEDHFIGKYKEVGIQFCEIDLKQRRRSNKRTYYVTIFKGLAVLLDMSKKRFYGHTILDKDRGKISEWFVSRSHGLKKANMVDPEFEKLFDAYTDDQVEARYLIDPLMIEKLKGLYEEYNGEKMVAAFYDSKMLILISSKHNHFEPADISVPATDPESVLNMKREIGQVLSII
ncbi:MAG: DUF3137 domain-containing protein, partial [Alphaproteobacteria bacterium]|nr:DUF3137 domain-containing protein [Alphaproteobacteria bacterium]